jgi:hypothetical protein
MNPEFFFAPRIKITSRATEERPTPTLIATLTFILKMGEK